MAAFREFVRTQKKSGLFLRAAKFVGMKENNSLWSQIPYGIGNDDIVAVALYR